MPVNAVAMVEARGGVRLGKEKEPVLVLRYHDGNISIKAEPHIRQFSENKRERWARIGKQVMCRVVYSYILTIRHYAPNTFSALPNFQ